MALRRSRRRKEIRDPTVKGRAKPASWRNVVPAGNSSGLFRAATRSQFWIRRDEMTRRFWMRAMVAAALTVGAAAAVGAAVTTPQFYKQVNLVSDDPNLA